MPNLYKAIPFINEAELLAQGTSFVHKLHPLAKLTGTLAYIACVISFPRTNTTGLSAFLLYPVITAAVANIPLRFFVARLLIAAPLSLAAALAGLFAPMGAQAFISVLIKTVLTVSAVSLLTATTKMTDVDAQLARLYVPAVFRAPFMMIGRYLSALTEEAAAMSRAYSMRSRGGKVAMRNMGSFLGQLILRSFDRAGRVSLAMKLRGNGNAIAITSTAHNAPRARDLVYIAALCAAFVLLRIFDISIIIGSLFINP
ncbi:MAG: energy-coupling factor transporter transmembrane protein EcfT [Oscillospiraceae bacterium]|jgi:cobalt/nickel transport system permease protein|nr:energy-coupling factor transporter transmembrane protein EcfT [Oscillospiraceae bacterium]